MIKILRRRFNAPEGKPNPSQLIATFPIHAEREADLLFATLQRVSTDFNNTTFSEWRYTKEVEPTKPKPRILDEQLVDISNAKPSNVYFRYSLSCRPSGTGESCHMIAFNTMKGVIRGTVPNDVQGRTLFYNRVKHVWPNAEIEK